MTTLRSMRFCLVSLLRNEENNSSVQAQLLPLCQWTNCFLRLSKLSASSTPEGPSFYLFIIWPGWPEVFGTGWSRFNLTCRNSWVQALLARAKLVTCSNYWSRPWSARSVYPRGVKPSVIFPHPILFVSFARLFFVFDTEYTECSGMHERGWCKAQGLTRLTSWTSWTSWTSKQPRMYA